MMDSEIIAAIFKIFRGFILTPGFPFRLGLMIATAIVLGFNVLRVNYRDMKMWIAVLFIFLIFQEWMRGSVVSSSNNIEDNLQPWILALSSGSIFAGALFFGNWLANYSKKCALKEHLEYEKSFKRFIPETRTD